MTALIYQAAALVLSYPDERVLAAVPTVRDALAGTDAAALFEPVLAHLEGGDLLTLQSYHVQEFDLSRRHALHLTYWTEGDPVAAARYWPGSKRCTGILG